MENSTTDNGGRKGNNNGSINDQQQQQQQESYSYPRRPQAKNCLFFVITGSCRYGQHCRFNHPLQTDAAVENHDDGRNQTVYWKSTRTIPCKFYSAGICKYGPYCRYYHPSAPAAVPADPTLVQYNSDGLPMRVGVPVCSFYMSTEWCGYGAICKFHHPELKQIGTDHQAAYVAPYSPAEAHPYAGSTAAGFSWY